MDEVETQATDPAAPVQDTAADQTSEASESSASTPEATQEVKETEVTATDTAQEERLFAGKYKSVEEMEKAYTELNSKFTNTSQEKAELTRLLNEAFLPPEPQGTDTEYEAQDDATATEDTSVKRDLSVMKFAMAHPDANGEEMTKVLAEDPMVKNIQGYEAKLAYAYAQARLNSQSKAIAEAQKQGKAQAQAKVAEKEVAQVESARKAEESDEGAELMDRAVNGSPDERKSARRAIIRKNLVKL